MWDLELPVVPTHVNKARSHVNPSLKECEEILQDPDLTVMAIGTLASGFLTPNQAYEYVNKFKPVKSVVVGASSKVHIEDAFHRFQRR
jgi:hypothetical protein